MGKEINMKTAYGYIRVSTHMQEEISPEAQKHEIQKWATAHEILITAWFQDNGISGKSADNRSEFQKMIALAKEKDHPDYILTWKFSRFARNQEESIVYKSLLRKNNVQVLSISEPLPEGPFSSLIERIIEWMDEYYSIRLAGEVRRGMKEKAKQGGYQSAPPLGYVKEKGNPVPIVYEPEATIYREIKDDCLKGFNPTTIARLINDKGYRTRRGNFFEARTITYILRNPFYVGNIRWNRVTHGGYHENAEEDIVIAKGKHEPLCSEEEWEEISKLMKKYKPGTKGTHKRSKSLLPHYLSGGLLRCPTCGASMSYSRGVQQNKKKAYPYFCCYKYAKGLHRGGGHITAKRCENALINSLQRFIDNGHSIITFSVEVKNETAEEEVKKYKSELQKLNIREKRAKDAYLDGIDTKEEYKENRRMIKEQISYLEEKITSLLNIPSDLEEIHVDIEAIVKKLQDETVSILEKHTSLESILEKMEYDKKTDEFRFYYLFDK